MTNKKLSDLTLSDLVAFLAAFAGWGFAAFAGLEIWLGLGAGSWGVSLGLAGFFFTASWALSRG